MPYSSVSDLPAYIKAKPAGTQRQWMAVFNSSYASCTKDGGSAKDCESKAFAQANGVIKGAEMADAAAASEPSDSDVHALAPLGVGHRRKRGMPVAPLMADDPMSGQMADMELPEFLLEKADKRVGYKLADPGASENCGNCRFFDSCCLECSLVEGTITAACVCSLWTAQMPLANAPADAMDMSEPPFAMFVDFTQAFSGSTSGEPQWIPFLPKPGKYEHAQYGEILITPEHNQALVDSVKNRVYQEHIPLDAEHETKLSGAVAWIKDMRMNEDGSADAFVEWTDRGRTLMAGGQFRYVSPEWFGAWKDPATGVVHRNVVAGGAITTRPFFKEKVLRALVASEAGAQIIADEAASYWFKDYSQEQRDAMAKNGQALPDGSYPIADKADLSNAIQAFGRAGNKGAAKAHIIKRARALGALDTLPEDWGGAKAASEGDSNMSDDTKDKGQDQAPPPAAPPAPDVKTFTAAEVDEKISAATAAFNERIQAAETLAAAEKAAREETDKKLTALVAEARHQRFTDMVAGRGGDGDGASWAGEPTTHVKMLEGLADKFGEDNELFTAYVESQKAIAAQLREANLFTEVGSSAGSSGLSDPVAKLDAMAKELATKSGKSYGEAYSEVMSSPEGAKIYASIQTRS